MKNKIIIALISLISFKFLACNTSEIAIDQKKTSNNIKIEKPIEMASTNIVLDESNIEKVESKYDMVSNSNKDVLSSFQNKGISLTRESIELFINSLNFKNLKLNNFDLNFNQLNNTLILNFDKNTTISEKDLDLFNEYISLLMFSVINDITILKLNMGDFNIINGKDFTQILLKEIFELTA